MKHFLIIALFCFSLNSFSQENSVGQEKKIGLPIQKSALTVGIFQGGGQIIGVDFEQMVSNRLGVQLGFGYMGFGAAINYHFKNTARSSFVSLSYWHQDFGKLHKQSLLGPSFVYRGKRWFTFNVGVGFQVINGPNKPIFNYDKPVQLTAGIGFYFAH